MGNPLDAYWDELVARSIATEAELQLVTDINGYTKETLDAILFSRTGYRSFDQMDDENGVDESVDLSEESNSVSSVTAKILEGMDISKAIALNCTTTILQDRGESGTDDVDELFTYIINDSELYRGIVQSTINNMQRKFRKGDYDPDLAVKAFLYVADAGIKKWNDEIRSSEDKAKNGAKLVFPKDTRIELATALRDYYDEQIKEDA